MSDRASLPILVYHSVSDNVTEAFRPYSVTPAVFEEHIGLLKDLGFVTLHLTDAAHRLFNRDRLPERAVVITFDDAFADFLDSALPVLRAADFVANLFVPSAYVNSTSRWLLREGEADRPIMTWSDIQIAASAGVEIGAHSHTHPQLDLLTSNSLTDELTRSKALIEDHLGREISTAAYPFGFYNANVRHAAKAAGYEFACAVGNLRATSDSDPWAIPRQTVKNAVDVPALERLLKHHSGRIEHGISHSKRVLWRAQRRLTASRS